MVLEARKKGKTRSSEYPNTKLWKKKFQKKEFVISRI